MAKPLTLYQRREFVPGILHSDSYPYRSRKKGKNEQSSLLSTLAEFYPTFSRNPGIARVIGQAIMKREGHGGKNDKYLHQSISREIFPQKSD
jgi:hypothetical protein